MIQHYSIHVCKIEFDAEKAPVSIFMCKVYNRKGSIIADPQVAFYEEIDAIDMVMGEMEKLDTLLTTHNCRIDCSEGSYIIDDDGNVRKKA